MSHPRIHAVLAPDKAAIVMSDTGDQLSYSNLVDLMHQGSQLLRSLEINTGDTIAIWLPNCLDYLAIYWAAQVSGLYITPIATSLTGDEAAYIVENSQARLLIANQEIGGLEGLQKNLPDRLEHILLHDEWHARRASMPAKQIDDESAGFHMVYSSGTTGRPKGVRLPLPGGDPCAPHILAQTAADSYGMGAQSVYLSPAPLYHAAPLAFCTSSHRLGATVVVMPKFDPIDALSAIENHNVTITQMVPTMFVRMLKLPDEERLSFDVSSLQCVIHAAAPCPVDVKRKIIEWFGPIVFEYYGGSEGNGSTSITSQEWLRKPGSVGRASWGKIHICNDEGDELGFGEQGIVYFEGGWDFKYLGDEEKTKDSRNPKHPGWSTLGDIGYLDEDGYLFLTDRKSFMIISGGVNIYPQEVENLLIGHAKVADVAVIGVPNPDFGEEVKAVIQPMDWEDATSEFSEELIGYCKEHLSPIKCPRSVDFDRKLPRLDNGKLYKKQVRDRYWSS